MRIRLQVAEHGVKKWVELEAASTEDAISQAVRAGWRVVAVDAPKTSHGLRRAKRFPLLIFSQELLALLQAGLNLVEAIATLHKKEADAAAKHLLATILERLREGRSFSEALAEHPATFPQVLVAGIAASERTGSLNSVFARFISYQLQLDGLRRKITSSTVYPILLLIVGGLVTLFLLGYVVPKFSVVLETSGREVTGGSRWLMWLGAALHQHPVVVGSVMATAILAAAGLGMTEAGRVRSLSLLTRVPAVARLVFAFSLTRFYRTVGTLLDSGIPLVKALGMSRSTLPMALQGVVLSAEERLRSGERLTAAFAGSALLPPVAESLLHVGERSGNLAEMMDRTASFLEDELARRIDLFSRTFEPVLMAFIGLVIGAVVVLMYMPIFDLVGSFQ